MAQPDGILPDQHVEARGEVRGYRTPIMIAGGYGNIWDQHIRKGDVLVGARLIALGGPSMKNRIGRRRRLVHVVRPVER